MITVTSTNIKSFHSILSETRNTVKTISKGQQTYVGLINNGIIFKIIPLLYIEECEDINNENRGENREIFINKLLTEKILDTNISPHIVKYLYSERKNHIPKIFNITNNEENIIGNMTFKSFINDIIEFGYPYLNCNILYTEYLPEILCPILQLPKYIDIIYFQILYTLSHIFNIYPSFKHGDLHLGNILFSIDKDYDDNIEQYNIYSINNSFFILPIIKYSIKIIDFEYSEIIGVFDNISINPHISKLPNQREDLLYFNKFFANDKMTKLFNNTFTYKIVNEFNNDESILPKDLLLKYSQYLITKNEISNFNILSHFGIKN